MEETLVTLYTPNLHAPCESGTILVDMLAIRGQNELLGLSTKLKKFTGQNVFQPVIRLH